MRRNVATSCAIIHPAIESREIPNQSEFYLGQASFLIGGGQMPLLVPSRSIYLICFISGGHLLCSQFLYHYTMSERED
jgi:hypothetical protein